MIANLNYFLKNWNLYVSISICSQRDNTELNHPYTMLHTGGLNLSVVYSDTLNSCHFTAFNFNGWHVRDQRSFVQKLDTHTHLVSCRSLIQAFVPQLHFVDSSPYYKPITNYGTSTQRDILQELSEIWTPFRLMIFSIEVQHFGRNLWYIIRSKWTFKKLIYVILTFSVQGILKRQRIKYTVLI
jgi:hypothetical protein